MSSISLCTNHLEPIFNAKPFLGAFNNSLAFVCLIPRYSQNSLIFSNAFSIANLLPFLIIFLHVKRASLLNVDGSFVKFSSITKNNFYNYLELNDIGAIIFLIFVLSKVV